MPSARAGEKARITEQRAISSAYVVHFCRPHGKAENAKTDFAIRVRFEPRFSAFRPCCHALFLFVARSFDRRSLHHVDAAFHRRLAAQRRAPIQSAHTILPFLDSGSVEMLRRSRLLGSTLKSVVEPFPVFLCESLACRQRSLCQPL